MKIETLQFKADPIWSKIESAEQAILRQLEKGHPVVIPFSGGKDSSVTASISLNAARKFSEAGGKPLIVATTSDTLVESPEIRALYSHELAKMIAYGKKHGFVVLTHIVTPTLAASWQVKVLTGRGLPSFVNNSSDCSVDLKVKSQLAFRKKLFASMKSEIAAEPISLLGTRFVSKSIRYTA